MLTRSNVVSVHKQGALIMLWHNVKRIVAWMPRSIFYVLLFLIQPIPGQIIPADRCVMWQGNAGVKGDIPENRKIFTSVTLPPYSAAGDGIHDDSQVIQRAIDDCPKGYVVYLPAGIYKITKGIQLKSDVTLRGAGIDSTSLQGAMGLSSTHLISFLDDDFVDDEIFQIAKAISGGGAKGSKRIEIVSHGYHAGDILLIDQLNDRLADPPITATGTSGNCTWCSRSNGERALGQIVEVESVPDGNTITLDIPLYYDLNANRSPQASRVNPDFLIRSAGIENLQIDNSLSVGDSQYNYGVVFMHAAIQCWMLNVKINTVYRAGLVIRFGSYRNTIRGCQICKSYRYTSNGGYGMWLYYGVSACLIENNIFSELATGLIHNGPVSGNVVAYNYFTDIISTDYPQSVRIGTAAHGGHPIMNLFEGNYYYGPYIDADFYWGSSSHNTYLRNKVAIDLTKTSDVTNVSLWKNQTYYNFVGNVLGTPGHENRYEGNDLYDGKMIFCLDYTNSGSSDGKTPATILRHGNFDYVNNATIWDQHIPDRTIPSSYYLIEKPKWWGFLPWPAIGPDCHPRDGDIPAKLRHEGKLVPVAPPARLRFIE